MPSSQKCPLCLGPAETVEHIIPQWLQRKLAVRELPASGQNLTLCNSTGFPISKATVRICRRCNNEIFSGLERRVQSGTATHQDYYLWALKISYLLNQKELNLPFDRSDPSGLSLSEPMWDETFVRSMMRSLWDPSFVVEPSPFGSVFVYRRPTRYTPKHPLFIDIPRKPFGVFMMSLADDRLLVIAFHDRGTLRRCGFKRRSRKIMGECHDARALLVLLMRELCMFEVPQELLMSDTFVRGAVPDQPQIRVPCREHYDYLRWFFCTHLQQGDQDTERMQQGIGRWHQWHCELSTERMADNFMSVLFSGMPNGHGD